MTSGIAQISASEIIGLKDKKESHPASNGRVGNMKGDLEMRKEQKEKAINKIKVLISELEMSGEEFVDYYNKNNPDSAYKLKLDDAYPFRCGWAQSELKYILKLIEN